MTMSTTKDLFITNRKGVREAFEKSDHDVLTDIQTIRQWIETQLHLPEMPNDNMIEMFLVMNKFSIERTKQKLDMYYTIRSLIPEIYDQCNALPLDISDNMGTFVILPKPTKELHRVYVMKIRGCVEDFDTYKFFAHMFNVMEVRIQNDITLGDVFVIDHTHLKMGHVLKMTPVHVKKATTIFEKVFSNRIKGMHIINYPPFLDILLSICKATLKPKIFARIHVHNSIEGLCEYISKDVLPVDYGGEEIPVEELNELWKRTLREHSDRFDKLAKMKVKEELRPTPLKNDEILGYHGNFKKLDVD